MKKRKPEVLRGLIGVACTGVFAVYAFVFSGDAMASRTAASVKPVVPQSTMPTGTDHTLFEHHLAKATRDDTHAETCMRRQILGGTEIYMATSFPPLDRPATEENPGMARAHIKKVNGKDKVLVIESSDPTVWKVTGTPSAIIVLGKAVLGEYPQSARIFAPRFASGCRNQDWVATPKNWNFPPQQAMMDSLVGSLRSRFFKRASAVSTKMFNRPVTSWRVQRGGTTIMF